MRIDVCLDSRLDPERLTELGLLAEKYGIGTVWNASYLNSRDPFSNLAALGQRSSRIRLGPIAVNPYEQHPVRIATSILTLNEISRGRANIIIGGGGEVIQALGIKPERRVTAVRECVEIIKAASTSRPLNYEGQLYQVRNYNPAWAEAVPPPVYVAANMPMMLKMAARVADGIMMGDMPPGLSRQIIDGVKDQLAGFGRVGEPFDFANFKAWHIYRNKDEAISEARQWLAYRALFRRWVITTFLSDEDYDLIESQKSNLYRATELGADSITGLPDRILDALVDQLTLTGHVSELDQKMEHLVKLKSDGVTSVTLELRKYPEESIKLIGEEVIPALR